MPAGVTPVAPALVTIAVRVTDGHRTAGLAADEIVVAVTAGVMVAEPAPVAAKRQCYLWSILWTPCQSGPGGVA